MFRLSMAALAVTLVTASVASAHQGRRLEVIVRGEQLAARGFDSVIPARPGGNPRAYLNAIHDEWSFLSTFSIATLPGFDVFTDANSVYGDGAADELAGGALTLTLVDAARWDPASESIEAFDELSTSVEIGFRTEPSITTTAPGTFEFSDSVSPSGEEDIDLDFFLASQPHTELHVLAWQLSTSATLPGDIAIADSSTVYTILSPDGGAFAQQALELERYLGTPLSAGDINRDGAVALDDYATWQDAFGQSLRFAGAGADLNHDATVNAADFVVWRDDVGPTAVNAVVVVPEPASGWLTLAALAGLVSAGRVSRRRPSVRADRASREPKPRSPARRAR